MVDNNKWAFVRGDVQNTGSSSRRGPIEEPQVKWRHDTGSRVFGTPLIVDDTVIVATQSPVHHTKGSVVAIDRDSGNRIWSSAEDSSGVRGTPAVANDRLCFGSLLGTLFVLDVGGGTVLHSADIGDSPSDGTYTLISEGTVFSQPYQLTAMDADSLAVDWESDDEAFFESPFAIAEDKLFAGGYRQDGDPVYIGQNDDDLPEFVRPQTPFVRAMDTATGTTQWETAIDGRPRGTAVVDGTVFIAAAGSYPLGDRVTRINPTSENQPVPETEPVPYESFGVVVALDAKSGTILWKTELSSTVRTMPATDGQYISVGTTAGKLVTLNATTGDPLWDERINENNAVLSSPTIAGDAVYVGSDDNAIIAFDLADGDELWRFESDAPVDANPAIVDGTVYAADNSGVVYSLEEHNSDRNGSRDS